MAKDYRALLAARWLLLAAFLLLAAVVPAAAQSDADTAKMVSLMQANNYSFLTTRSPVVWVIHSTGAHLKDVKMVLSYGGDPAVMVVFVTVTEKRRMPVTTDFMRALLEKNHTYDRVKIAFDSDGDLEVRTDASLRVTDATEFRDIVHQVQNVSDELYGVIESQLAP